MTLVLQDVFAKSDGIIILDLRAAVLVEEKVNWNALPNTGSELKTSRLRSHVFFFVLIDLLTQLIRMIQPVERDKSQGSFSAEFTFSVAERTFATHLWSPFFFRIFVSCWEWGGLQWRGRETTRGSKWAKIEMHKDYSLI